MTIHKIKEELGEHIGDKAMIKYSLGRNKYEKYEVVIEKLYNNIFFFFFGSGKEVQMKSFSYIDIITKTIKIDYDA